MGLTWWLRGKESACQGRRCWRCRFNPWVRKIPGVENGSPLQYPCLDRRAGRLRSMGSQRVSHDSATEREHECPVASHPSWGALSSNFHHTTEGWSKNISKHTKPLPLNSRCGHHWDVFSYSVLYLESGHRDILYLPGLQNHCGWWLHPWN